MRFISTGEEEFEELCPEYLDMLHREGCDAEHAATVAWQTILSLSWNRLELLDMPSDSRLICTSPYPVALRGVCPIANLTGGFESYLERLSANTRQRARRLLRAADAAGASLEFATPENVDLVFDDLIRLHQERWMGQGEPGCFAAPRFKQFHRDLARSAAATGRVVLVRLKVEGATQAVLYGFLAGTKFDFYQSGVALCEAGTLRNYGTTAHLLLMRSLCARGVCEYDFLRGSAQYKQSLSSTSNQLMSISTWRNTVGGLGARCSDVLRRGWKRVWK